MTQRTRKILTQVGSFVLAGVLLYLALRGVDPQTLIDALRSAEYAWLAPLVLVVLGSHFLRAWRWQLLLETLPERESRTERVSLKTAFYSVMIGYMVNYAAPRLGEVVRTGNLAAREQLQFSSVLGTVVAERVLDVIVLLLALISVFALFFDRITTLSRLFLQPAWESLGTGPILAIAALTAGIAVMVILIGARAMRIEEGRLATLWHTHVRPLLDSFRDGLFTLLRCPHRTAIVGSTAAIWFLYLLMAYIPLVMLGLAGPYDLSLVDGWAVMILGALGVVVPSPGGTGSYHYITRQTLVHLFGMPGGPAVAYAVITHAAQLVLYAVAGFVCLILQGTALSQVRDTAAEIRADRPDERSAEVTARESS